MEKSVVDAPNELVFSIFGAVLSAKGVAALIVAVPVAVVILVWAWKLVRS